MTTTTNLTKTLQELEQIAGWFEQQGDIDVEEGLVRVQKAAVLIKESKKRLAAIENAFEEIKNNIHEA